MCRKGSREPPSPPAHCVPTSFAPSKTINAVQQDETLSPDPRMRLNAAAAASAQIGVMSPDPRERLAAVVCVCDANTLASLCMSKHDPVRCVYMRICDSRVYMRIRDRVNKQVCVCFCVCACTNPNVRVGAMFLITQPRGRHLVCSVCPLTCTNSIRARTPNPQH